jgi:hypothetical protein
MFGTVFFKTYWDDMLHPRPPMPLPALDLEGQPIVTPQGQPEIVVDGKGRPKMQEVPPDGDVALDMLSVFDIHAPVSAVTPFPRDWPWIAEKVAMSTGEVEARYGVRLEPDAKAVDITSQLSLDLGKFFSRGDQVYGESRSADSAWVIEYHEAPSTTPGFEQGRRIIVAGEELVANEPGVLSDGRLPYHAMPVIPIPLSPWGDCFVPETLEPQMAYNKARSELSRARSRLAHPHCIAPIGAISGDKSTDGGRWIEYNFAKGKPEVLDLPGIDSATVSELRAAREDVDIAASQYAFTRGEPLGASPQPVSSIELMQHADTTDLLYALRFGAEAMADIGTDLLDLARENYTSERTGMVIGESEDPDIFQYSRTDIAPGLQVVVQEGSEIPVVKEGIRSQLSEIIKSGVLAPVMQDPTFIEHMLELYDMPAPEQMGSLGGLDMRVQERETREILAGQGGAGQGPGQEPYPLNETDDDNMHIMSIDRRTKYGDWKKIPPDRQAALLAHRQLHIMRTQQRMIEQMQQQLAMQQMMQQATGPPPGGPGGPPEGGPPPEGPPRKGE